MQSQMIKPEDNMPAVPGIGVAGKAICPIMSIGRFIPQECVKHQCELWMEFQVTVSGEQKMVGRCSLAWAPKIAVEIREEIERTRKGVKK